MENICIRGYLGDSPIYGPDNNWSTKIQPGDTLIVSGSYGYEIPVKYGHRYIVTDDYGLESEDGSVIKPEEAKKYMTLMLKLRPELVAGDHTQMRKAMLGL